MSSASDHLDDMPDDTLTDAALEAFFVGSADPAWEQEQPLVALAGHMAAAVAGPAPTPDHALLQLFWGREVEPSAAAVSAVTRHAPSSSERSPRRLLAGLALGVAGMFASVGAAGATGILPDPAQRVVARAVEVVTPFQLPSAHGGSPTPSSRGGTAPAVAGREGSSAGPGAGTVPGPAPSSGQPGAQPTTAPGSAATSDPGSTGLNRAGQTPAADNAPSRTPVVSGLPEPATEAHPPATAVGPPTTTVAPSAGGLDRAAQAQAGNAAPSTVPATPGGRSPARP